jgi:hypothetical protein
LSKRRLAADKRYSLASMSGIELHDSEVGAITPDGQDLRVVFRPAYVHRSDGKPGIDSGWGYLQPVEFTFRDATYAEDGHCKGTVSHGSLTCAGAEFRNLVPMPLSLDNPVSVELVFVSGGVLSVQAASFSCLAMGEVDPSFRERYEG